MRRVLLAVAGVVIALLLYDWFSIRPADLRSFNPAEVARLETRMWRDYYNRKSLRLFAGLSELLHRQYRMPRTRSCVAAFHAARAAFVFKGGRSRQDYERALPDLRRYYAAIRASSSTPFDVERAARSELKWWISHRERLPSLERDLAALQSVIYSQPPEVFAEHARDRADAMHLRDAFGAAGAGTDSDWWRVYRHLVRSWTELHVQVNAAAGAGR